MTWCRVLWGMSLLVLGAGMAPAWAQQGYPNRPITLVVPFSGGGPTDVIARSVGVAMGKYLKQPVVIENVGGAGGTIGATQVAQAAPDGYTLLMYHIGMATSPALYPGLPFDPLRDFEAVGEVTDVPMALIARGDFPVTRMKDLPAYLKTHRQVRLAHAGLGSASQLCSLLLLAAMETTDLKTIVYKGTGPALEDLVAGKVDLLCDQTTNTMPHIRAGNVLALGISTRRRLNYLPELPTLQEGGLKNFEVAVWHTLYVPQGTPAPVVKRLTEALQFALQDPNLKTQFQDLGTEPVPLLRATPQHARQHLVNELQHWKALIDRQR